MSDVDVIIRLHILSNDFLLAATPEEIVEAIRYLLMYGGNHEKVLSFEGDAAMITGWKAVRHDGSECRF